MPDTDLTGLVGLHPLDTPSADLDSGSLSSVLAKLDGLRARLMQMQHEENAAIRRWGEFLAEAILDEDQIRILLQEIQDTRERARAAYDDWSDAVKRLERRLLSSTDGIEVAGPPRPAI